jgi:hypothetical protein
MTRKIIQTVIAFLLVACGWAVGRAQTPAPEFTLTIDAPGGRTMVKCVRGCTLQGGQDEGNPNNRPRPQYSFECSGVTQCSATVNGWLKH